MRDRESKQPAREETVRIIAGCHARGLIVIPAGTYGNVIRILVPLVATDTQVCEGLSVLETAIAEVASQGLLGPVGRGCGKTQLG